MSDGIRDAEGKRAAWLTNEAKRRNVLEVALDVHMTATGAMDRAYGSGDQERDIAHLKQRLSAWSPTILPRSRRFDAAVAELIEAALAETWEEPPNVPHGCVDTKPGYEE